MTRLTLPAFALIAALSACTTIDTGPSQREIYSAYSCQSLIAEKQRLGEKRRYLMHKRQMDAASQTAHVAGMVTDLVNAIESAENGGIHYSNRRNAPYERDINRNDYKYDIVSEFIITKRCAAQMQPSTLPQVSDFHSPIQSPAGQKSNFVSNQPFYGALNKYRRAQ